MVDKPEVKDDQLHERIIKAALELFANDGFHAVPVPKIAEKADVGIGSIYRVAPSKIALAHLVFEDCVERLKRSVFEPIDLDFASGSEMFFAYWKRVSDWLMADPVYMRFMVLYRFVGPPYKLSGIRQAGVFSSMVDLFVAKKWVRPLDLDLVISLISGPLVVMTLDGTLSHERLDIAGETIWAGLQPN